MVYKFSYYTDGTLIYETYTDETYTQALAKFLWLTNKKIPFKIITTTKRRNRY